MTYGTSFLSNSETTVLTNLIHPYATARRREVQRSRGRRLLFESLETRQLLAGDLAARFEFASTAGNVVSSLSVGQDFELRLYVQDIRAVPTGVFQAYFDISYPANLATATGDIVHGAEFSFAGSTSGTAATPGSIDEVGGIDTDQYVPPAQVGNEEQLFRVPMRAIAAGTLNLTLDRADQPNRIVAFFSPVTDVQLDRIDVRGNSIVIGSGTIAPSLAIAAADAVKFEGNSALTPYTFTVTRSGQNTGATTVNWAVTGSGTNPANTADFGGTLPSGMLSFAAGETSKTITVNVAGETVVESDEGFTVMLSGASGGATITTAAASGTIRNDDSALSIAALNANKLEGNSGTTPLTFTVTRSGYTGGATSVNWAVTGNGANPANAVDFGGTLPSGTVSFAAGEISKTITVNVAGETVVEPDEGFTVMLSGASGGATITTAAASGTIRTDDSALSIAALNANKLEGSSGTTPLTFTVTRSGYTGGATSVNWAVTGSGANPANAVDFGGTLPSGTVSFAAGETSKTITVNVTGDTLVEPDEGFTVTLSGASGGTTIAAATASGTIRNDDSATFRVDGVTPMDSGFVVDFNAPFKAERLNLYDNAASVLGPADMTVVGAAVGSVRGSVVVRGDKQQLIFIKTGGPLEPDTYTVTLRSAADGFVDSSGNLLDGEGNGVAGGNFISSFVIGSRPANEVTISVPDFARGFGQTVNLPSETATGIPVMLSTGQNVTAVDLDLVFDPTLLDVTSFSHSVAGASSSFHLVAPGRMRITISSASQFRATSGTIELGRFLASVPATAPYAAKQILRLENVGVEDTVPQPRPVRTDHGLHLAAFVGDSNAGRTYTGGDATLLQRLIVGHGSGLSTYPLADPMLITDVNRSDTLTGGDATLLHRMVVGTPISQAPAPPSGIVPPPISGPDPLLFIPTDLTGKPGDTVTVPVMLEVTEASGISVAAIDLAIAYDPEIFTASNFVRGAMLDGFGFSSPTVNIDTPGILRVTMSTASGPELAFGATGVVFQFDVVVHTDAPEGSSRINLLQSFESTFTGLENNEIEPLTLIPAPTNADDDPVDGVLTITSAAARLSISATDADRPEGNSGPTPFLFTITRSGLTTETTTVNFAVTGSGPNPTDATDFGDELPGGQITFEPGETEKTLTINASGDVLVEPDEGFTVTLSDASDGTQIITAPASGTIRNDDTQVTVSVAPSNVLEDDGQALVYTFARVGVISEPLTVAFLVNGTADFGVDYTQAGAASFSATEGSVTFAADSTTAAVGIVPVVDDLVEDDETVILSLVPGDRYKVGAPDEAVGTIVDDDRPCVFIEDAVPILEGDEDSRPLAFSVRLCRPMDMPLSIDYATRDGAATATDGDYQPVSGTLIFRPGEALVQTVEVLVFGDRRVEPDEDVFVDLSNLATADPDAVVTGSTARGVIVNDDTEVAIQVASESVPEDSGQTLIFTFSREGTTENALTVDFQVDGSAAFDVDYTVSGAASFAGNAGTVTFPAGTTTVTVAAQPVADQIVEEDETIVLTLVPGTGYTIAALATATGTIQDDDTDVWITVSPEAIPEDSGLELSYTFTRFGVVDQPLTVQFSVGGDAVLNVDYVVDGAASFSDSAGSIQFAADQTMATVVVRPVSDDQVEPDETVVLTLLSDAGYQPVDPTSATGTIVNDDTGLSIRATDAVRREGDGGTTPFTFTVERTGLTEGEATVDYSISGTGTHPADADDFGGALPNGQVTFAPGETLQTITVLVTGDTEVEPHEGFTVTLSNASAGVTIPEASAEGTILNDDVRLAIAPVEAVKSEGSAGSMTEFTFAITRIGMAAEDLEVSWQVSGSGEHPAAGEDFGGALPGGSLIFSADGSVESMQTINVLVSGDNELEPDEGFTVTLSEVSEDALITTATAEGLILNDDVALAIAPEDAVKFEGQTGTTEFTFTVTRQGSIDGSTTIAYAVTGSGSNPADADDFGGTLPSGQVTFGPSETVRTITILVRGDTVVEPDEGFSVALADPPQNTQITDSSAEGSILNDDAVLRIAAVDAVKFEGDVGIADFTFTVTRVGFAGNEVTVDYTVTGSGTQPADAEDFGGNFPGGQLTFAPDEMVQTIVIPVSGDTEVEPDEEFAITLSNATGGADIEIASAQGSILNDDTRIRVRVEPSEVPEDSGQPLQFIFDRDGANTLPLTVNFTVTGAATLDSDYVQTGAATFSSTTGTVLIPAGVSTATVTIQPLSDRVVELDETLALTLTPGSGYLVGQPASATGTILNDDSATLSIEDGTLLEPETGTQDLVLRVRLHDSQGSPTTVDVAVNVDWIFTHQTTDDADFGPSLQESGTLLIPAGQSEAELRFPVIADEVVELDETFLVTLSNLRTGDPARDVQLGPSAATGTIQDDPMTGELRGHVYQDGNADGGRDAPSERGIPGIFVTLTGTTSSGNAIELVAMTDADGAYAFIGLQAGTYEIRQRQSTAMLDGPEELGSQQGQMEDDRFFNITLAPAAKGEGYHFGERGWRPQYITRRMFLASSQMTSEALRVRIAQIEENNGHTLIAQQIRDVSIPSIVDARAASVAAMSPSIPSAAAQAAAPVFDPSDHSVPQGAAVGEGEATESDWTAVEPPRQDATIASHGVASPSEPDASLMPPAMLSLPSEPPSAEPATGQSEVISQQSAPLTPAPRSNPLVAFDPNTESLFELLAWEAANVPTDSSHVDPAHSDLPPVAPLDEEALLGDATAAELYASSAAQSTPLKLESANGLDTEIVDELFGGDDDLLALPVLVER